MMDWRRLGPYQRQIMHWLDSLNGDDGITCWQLSYALRGNLNSRAARSLEGLIARGLVQCSVSGGYSLTDEGRDWCELNPPSR